MPRETETISDISAAAPPSIDHVVGQTRAVRQLRVALMAYRNERAAGKPCSFGHVLLAGPPGLGKTTLAAILARELDADMRETLGQSLHCGDDLNTLLMEATDRTVLFVDEAHEM